MQTHLERIVEINTKLSKRVTNVLKALIGRRTEDGALRVTESGLQRLKENETN